MAWLPYAAALSTWWSLQAVWFVQLIPQIESNGFSITPGRFDQYMYPFYKEDIEDGAIEIIE